MQVDSPLQKKWRGTGLGLALSKKIAELLGGSVSMTSEPNVGSTFSVTIPIRIGEQGTPHRHACQPDSESPLQPKELLPCSSWTTTRPRSIPLRVLRNEGYRVVEASTGTEAVPLASGDIDLAILDINLPDIDGYEVCRRIRAMKSTRVPVVHLSASFVTDRDRVTGWNLEPTATSRIPWNRPS